MDCARNEGARSGMPRPWTRLLLSSAWGLHPRTPHSPFSAQHQVQKIKPICYPWAAWFRTTPRPRATAAPSGALQGHSRRKRRTEMIKGKGEGPEEKTGAEEWAEVGRRPTMTIFPPGRCILNAEGPKQKEGFYFNRSGLHILGGLPRDVSRWKGTETGF